MELHYGDWMHKSQTARERAIEVVLLFSESEHHMDVMPYCFYDGYAGWEDGKLPIAIPSSSMRNVPMPLQMQGWKEAEMNGPLGADRAAYLKAWTHR